MSTLWIFGYNGSAQLGNSTTADVFIPIQNITSPIPTNVNSISSIYNISYSSAIIRKTSPYLLTVGDNSSGQLGINTSIPSYGYSIFQTPDIKFTPVKASGGSSFILLLATDDKLYGSGIGQNGLGRPNNTTTFEEISQTPSKIISIDSGDTHSALLYFNGIKNVVQTTGQNSFGELGTSNTSANTIFTDVVTYSTPLLIGENITQISCGYAYTCFVTNQNNIYSTGDNSYGQLGLNDEKNRLIFTKVNNSFLANGESIIQISCGASHTCVLTNLNNIYSTGENGFGQLGLNDKINRLIFTKVNNSFLENGESIKQISCSFFNTNLLTSNGRILITGQNNLGQLGNPENIPSSSDTFIEINTTNVTNTGFTLISTGSIGYSVFAYKDFNPCFSEGTKILCLNNAQNELSEQPIVNCLKEEYRLVQDLMIGDFVKSYLHGYRKISKIIKGEFVNNPHTNGCSNCMYRMLKTDDNGLIEDLTLTRNHGILVEKMSEDEEKKVDKNNLQIIDNLLSIITADSDKFEKVLDTNVYKYYHFALETDGDNDRRFGVWANGILVETPSNNMMDGALNIKPLDF